jgi:hypothetical protein
MKLDRKLIRAALGDVDDVVAAEIIAMGATADELAEARAWLVNDEPLMNSGKPLPGARISQLAEILTAIEEDNSDDSSSAPRPA